MIKTLIVEETTRHVILKGQITRPATPINPVVATLSSIEVARFAKSGMGYCALGAAGRMLTSGISLDAIEFHGTQDLHDRLVGMGVIDPVMMPADAA